MTIRELEILRAALEGDIINQKKSDKLDHPAFKEWLKDTEILLRKVTLKLMNERAKKEIIKQSKFFKGYDPKNTFLNL